MSTQTNIFQRLAQNNDTSNFDFSPIAAEDNSTGNIFQKMSKDNIDKKDQELTYLGIGRDIGEQVVSKGVSGVGGAYGNILEAFGLQSDKELPGKLANEQIQASLLDRLNRGEQLSAGELEQLTEEDLVPQARKLPTSKGIEAGIESLTGIGEGKSTAGRIAGQGAKFVGEGAATGGGLKNLIALGLSGAAGQGVREAGGPEWAATAVEIGGSLSPSLISRKLITSGKTAKDVIEAGRKIGLTEAQITPLIQSEGKAATLAKVARKGTKTKELFASIKERLGDSYNRIKGLKEAKVKLPNADQIQLRKEFGNIRNELSKTLAPSPEKEAALNYIEKSLETLRNADITPEYLVNFWQDVNKTVKWNSISGGKKALAQLKEPVSKVLKKVSPQLAEDFELTNDLYTKYSQISKKLKPDLVDSFVNKGEILTTGPGVLALAQGNPWILAGLGSEVAVRLLAREMLINPYFQNLATKLVTNFNSGSVNAIKNIGQQAKEYMQRKHPDEDWAFLTNAQSE